MIELERRGTRGDPGKEARFWAEKLAQADLKRARYQQAFAADAVTLAELKAYLAELDETRKTAEKEMSALRDHEERVRGLERDRDAVLDSLEAQAPKTSTPSRPRSTSSGSGCSACGRTCAPTARWRSVGPERRPRPFVRRQRYHDQRFNEREALLAFPVLLVDLPHPLGERVQHSVLLVFVDCSAVTCCLHSYSLLPRF
jgi:hypothetical protein